MGANLIWEKIFMGTWYCSDFQRDTIFSLFSVHADSYEGMPWVEVWGVTLKMIFGGFFGFFGVFAKVRTQEFRKSVWSWSEIFIRDKKKSMEVVWNTEALVQCGGAPGTLRILRVFARFQLNISRFFFAILREPLVKPRVKVWGVALKITSP